MKHEKYVNKADYYELNLILWDWGADLISEEAAFRKYEERWRFIDPKKMANKEKAFVEYLTKEYGRGVFLSA